MNKRKVAVDSMEYKYGDQTYTVRYRVVWSQIAGSNDPDSPDFGPDDEGYSLEVLSVKDASGKLVDKAVKEKVEQEIDGKFEEETLFPDYGHLDFVDPREEGADILIDRRRDEASERGAPDTDIDWKKGPEKGAVPPWLKSKRETGIEKKPPATGPGYVWKKPEKILKEESLDYADVFFYSQDYAQDLYAAGIEKVSWLALANYLADNHFKGMIVTARKLEALGLEKKATTIDSVAKAIYKRADKETLPKCEYCKMEYTPWDGHAGCCSWKCQQERMESEDEAKLKSEREIEAREKKGSVKAPYVKAPYEVECRGCDGKFYEGHDSPSVPTGEHLVQLQDEDGVFWGCPSCKTDEFLMDIEGAADILLTLPSPMDGREAALQGFMKEYMLAKLGATEEATSGGDGLWEHGDVEVEGSFDTDLGREEGPEEGDTDECACLGWEGTMYEGEDGKKRCGECRKVLDGFGKNT